MDVKFSTFARKKKAFLSPVIYLTCVRNVSFVKRKPARLKITFHQI
jgi:hypothetical protein